MFTEELAREIGIAYSLYSLNCQLHDTEPMKEDDFTAFVLFEIEEVRKCKGLANENDVCG